MRSTTFCLALCLGLGALVANAKQGQASLRILFIGNSLTYSNDLPAVVVELGRADGVEVVTMTKAEPNHGLQDHWARARTRAALNGGRWDYVVLQQGPSSLPANQANLRHWAAKWSRVIRASGAKPALYMVWPSTSRLKAFPAVDQAYSDAARVADAILLPAGRAWWAALQLEAGPTLYGSDGFHPDPTGTLLAALVIYAGLTGQVPAQLPDQIRVGSSELRIGTAERQVLLHAARTALNPLLKIAE